jgi:hypothetical protein
LGADEREDFEERGIKAMELLDRYLEAVRKQLPWERQDDIIAELRANLESQLEDRQEEVGHPLTPDEAKAWVGQLPAPRMMAARYRPQQALIGPALFPTYWFIVRMVAMWVFVLAVIENAVRLGTHAWSAAAIPVAIISVIGIVLANVAAVTLVFAVIEYAGVHYPGRFPQIAKITGNWDLNDLPRIEPVKGEHKRTFGLAVTDAIIHALLLVWILLLPRYPVLILGPGLFAIDALPYTYAPILADFYWAVVIFSVVHLVWKLVDLYTGAWMGERRLQHFTVKLLGMIPLAIALRAPGHLWIVLKDPAAEFAKYGTQLAQINEAIYLGLRMVLAIVVITFVLELGKLWLVSFRRRVVRAH